MCSITHSHPVKKDILNEFNCNSTSENNLFFVRYKWVSWMRFLKVSKSHKKFSLMFSSNFSSQYCYVKVSGKFKIQYFSSQLRHLHIFPAQPCGLEKFRCFPYHQVLVCSIKMQFKMELKNLNLPREESYSTWVISKWFVQRVSILLSRQ